MPQASMRSSASSGPMAGRANSRASSVLGLTSTAARTAPAMLRPRALLEPAPVAAPVEPHDPPESRRLEVSGGHENRFALQAFHEGPSSLAGQLRVPVGPCHPVGLVQLPGAVG